MLTSDEKAINNSFQIIEDFKANEVRKSFYHSKKAKFRLRAQRPGKVKIFSEREILLLNIKQFNENERS